MYVFRSFCEDIGFLSSEYAAIGSASVTTSVVESRIFIGLLVGVSNLEICG